MIDEPELEYVTATLNTIHLNVLFYIMRKHNEGIEWVEDAEICNWVDAHEKPLKLLHETGVSACRNSLNSLIGMAIVIKDRTKHRILPEYRHIVANVMSVYFQNRTGEEIVTVDMYNEVKTIYDEKRRREGMHYEGEGTR